MQVTPEFDYAEAHDPDFTRIMGVRLLPFRTGHKRLLQRDRSTFLFEDAGEIRPIDLIAALWVCSRSYAEASAKKPSLLWKFYAGRLERWLSKHEDVFNDRVGKFFEYMAEAYSRPKSMRKVRKDGEPEPEITFAPNLMVLKRDLMGKHGYSEAAFWEMPIRKANYERFAQLEEDRAVTWPEGWEVGE